MADTAISIFGCVTRIVVILIHHFFLSPDGCYHQIDRLLSAQAPAGFLLKSNGASIWGGQGLALGKSLVFAV
jgi:hypothetical protein